MNDLNLNGDEINEQLIKEKHTSWRPNERGQKQALQVPNSVFEMLFGGSLGGGKSELLLAIPIVKRTLDNSCQLYEHPFFRGIIFRRTFPQLEKSLIPRAKHWYINILGAKYNETKHSFTFPSGAIVYLSHMERQDDVRKFDTDEYNFIGVDQAEEFTEFQLRYISSRIRSSIPELPKLYYLSANPGGVSHTYLRDRFVKPYPDGNVIIKDRKTGVKRIFIPARLNDNPYLVKNDPDYINRLQMLPEKEREAKISGNWFTFSGRVFTELRRNRIPSEPDNAYHMIAPFDIPDWWPRILALDWGFTAKTFGIWAAMSPEHRIIIYRTYSKRKTNISTWATEVAERSQYEHLSRVILDPSAWQQRGDELTIQQQFTKWSGLAPKKADNDRIGGKQLLHDMLRWEPKPIRKHTEEISALNIEHANELLREKGIAAYHNYLDSFTPEAAETNIPKLLFFDGGFCTELLDCLEDCQYEEKDGRNTEDVKEFDGDDPYDAIRYLLKETDHFIVELKRTAKYRERYNEIMAKFEVDRDYNALENRMMNLENQKVMNEVKAVSLYD